MPASVPALLSFTLAAGALTMTPGVDTMTVLRSASTGGARVGAAAAFGICAGLFVWAAGAAFGLTALLAVSAGAFTALQWVGAAYLVGLGLRLLVVSRAAAPALPTQVPHGRGAGVEAVRRGFLTNVLNPKVGVFYVTFLPQFIPADANVAGFSLLLASVHVLLTLVWFALLIALTAPLGRWLARPRVATAFDRLTGCILVAFGVRLALAPRP